MIQVTDAAARELKRIIEQQTLPETTALRLGVKGGGCSGFSYTMGLDRNEPAETDKVFVENNVRVFVDMKSYLYLNDTIVDYNESLQKRGFEFKNPNAASVCGCGESFAV